MGRIQGLVLVGLLLVGGGWFFKNFKVDGLKDLTVSPRPQQPGGNTTGGGGLLGGITDVFNGGGQPAPPASATDSIRICTFNIQVFGESKLADQNAMGVICDIIRKFDVVAVQEVRAVSQDVLPRFVEMINSTGVRYDFVLGPRLGRTSSKEQYAFVFNTARIEVDRSSIYTVNDPDDALHREPLVAGFRVRGPPPEQAFTFTLINIHTDPDEVKEELPALVQVLNAVRADGRGEDDVLLLGDLNADEKIFGPLGRVPSLAWVVTTEPTNTRRTKTYDNILFDRRATTEFVGRAGVFDMTQEYRLTPEQSLQVSDHLPVWAEFSVYEGGRAGYVAARPGEVR